MSGTAVKKKLVAVKLKLTPWEREMMYQAHKILDQKEHTRENPALFNETYQQVCPHCGRPVLEPVLEERTRL